MELTLSEIAEYKNDYLEHHGIRGQKWGVRRYQNEDGTYTDKGKKRYAKLSKHAARMNAYKEYAENRFNSGKNQSKKQLEEVRKRATWASNAQLKRDAFDAKYNNNSKVKNKDDVVRAQKAKIGQQISRPIGAGAGTGVGAGVGAAVGGPVGAGIGAGVGAIVGAAIGKPAYRLVRMKNTRKYDQYMSKYMNQSMSSVSGSVMYRNYR